MLEVRQEFFNVPGQLGMCTYQTDWTDPGTCTYLYSYGLFSLFIVPARAHTIEAVEAERSMCMYSPHIHARLAWTFLMYHPPWINSPFRSGPNFLVGACVDYCEGVQTFLKGSPIHSSRSVLLPFTFREIKMGRVGKSQQDYCSRL